MMTGIEKFKDYFKGHESKYVIIGGTACALLMEENGLDFRATRDIDMVLIVEALTADFGTIFWSFISAGKYQHLNKSTGTPQFYRFSDPADRSFPAMIELFSYTALSLPTDAVLTPLHIDDSVSSLSAILLNKDYYDFLKCGMRSADFLSVLDIPYLIAFKAKAWLDLSARKAGGEPIDSKNIKKHKNDVFRLSVSLSPEDHINVPQSIADDIHLFIDAMRKEPIDLKALHIRGSKDSILDRLEHLYFPV